jgi:hypothetical protein
VFAAAKSPGYLVFCLQPDVSPERRDYRVLEQVSCPALQIQLPTAALISLAPLAHGVGSAAATLMPRLTHKTRIAARNHTKNHRVKVLLCILLLH